MVGGGVIPDDDIPGLKEAGVAEICAPHGTPTTKAIEFINTKRKEKVVVSVQQKPLGGATMNLQERLAAGDVRALAKASTYAENDYPESRRGNKNLYGKNRQRHPCYKGITRTTPEAGKSILMTSWPRL